MCQDESIANNAKQVLDEIIQAANDRSANSMPMPRARPSQPEPTHNKDKKGDEYKEIYWLD